MFAKENSYARAVRQSIHEGRSLINLEKQKRWIVNEPSEADGLNIPGRCVYAQNDGYLELCNPGWDLQWRAAFGFFVVVPFFAFIVWGWYGFALHPLIFGKIIFLAPWYFIGYEDAARPYLFFGWLVLFPLALGSILMLHVWWNVTGIKTSFFTYARGRIRFNRIQRKVYVLRPDFCGGNAIFDWDRLCALFAPDGVHPYGKQETKGLALYSPPLDPHDPDAKGEDCFFVGPSLISSELEAPGLWEYIRRYMEEGPSVDYIPPNAPVGYAKVPRYLPQNYTTYCGKPSMEQYQLEQGAVFTEAFFHMLSQMTCSWPRFPKEWQSDSGMGEPEDRPVQTGAVMTAMVYRAEGKLSKEDEIEFLTHWGTEEALAEARETRASAD